MQQALEQFPEDLNLLYTRAMLAEKRDNLALLEQDLRFILEREPDNAMALNALGYTLADRTTRYSRSQGTDRAGLPAQPARPGHSRQPWLGELPPGQPERGGAPAAPGHSRPFPDHEVAAHLGEVLWAQGKQKEARATLA